MIARVTLEIALRKEFDYFIPPELAEQVDVGSRVQVPFGSRKVMGCVTGLAEESAHARLKPILKVLGAQTLVTPSILKLARWIGDYYCCAPETALKSVLPEAVRHEQANWRERLHVRALPVTGDLPKLPKRQKEVWRILQERPELPLAELLMLAKTTAATVRRLEDRGLVTLAAEISERDPYAREHILPSQPLPLNPAQANALAAIKAAMDGAQKSEVRSQKSEGQSAEGAGVQGSKFEVQGSMFDVGCSFPFLLSAFPPSSVLRLPWSVLSVLQQVAQILRSMKEPAQADLSALVAVKYEVVVEARHQQKASRVFAGTVAPDWPQIGKARHQADRALHGVHKTQRRAGIGFAQVERTLGEIRLKRRALDYRGHPRLRARRAIIFRTWSASWDVQAVAGPSKPFSTSRCSHPMRRCCSSCASSSRSPSRTTSVADP